MSSYRWQVCGFGAFIFVNVISFVFLAFKTNFSSDRLCYKEKANCNSVRALWSEEAEQYNIVTSGVQSTCNHMYSKNSFNMIYDHYIYMCHMAL